MPSLIPDGLYLMVSSLRSEIRNQSDRESDATDQRTFAGWRHYNAKRS